jgi:hypothetical protein
VSRSNSYAEERDRGGDRYYGKGKRHKHHHHDHDD